MTEEGDNGEYFNPEEEVKIAQTCALPKAEIKTGEEDEDLIYKGRGRLYRFREKEWKERSGGRWRHAQPHRGEAPGRCGDCPKE